jgi:hypothetical protein
LGIIAVVDGTLSSRLVAFDDELGDMAGEKVGEEGEKIIMHGWTPFLTYAVQECRLSA